MGGGGDCNFVVEEGMSPPNYSIAAARHVASTAQQALAGFTFTHSQAVHVGGCSPPHLMWEVVTQGQWVPDHQVLHISDALHT